MREEQRGRMEAVVQSLQDADWNFSKASITWTVRNLLDIYGPKAGWSYIEENNYQIVVDCITSDKKLKQSKDQMRSGRDGKAAIGRNSSRTLQRGAGKAAAAVVPPQMEQTVFCGSPEGHSPDSPDIRSHQRHLWSVRCGLPNLPCFWEPYEGEQPVLDVTEAGPGPEVGSDGDCTVKSGGNGNSSCGRVPDSVAEKSDDNGVHDAARNRVSQSFEAGFQVKVRGKRSRPSLGRDVCKQIEDVTAVGSPPLVEATCGTEPSIEGSRSVGENPSPSVVSNESVHEAGVSSAGVAGRADSLGQGGPELQARPDSAQRSLGLAEAEGRPEGIASEDIEVQLTSKRRKAGENGIGMLRKIRGFTTARGAIVPHGANGTSTKGFSTRTHQVEPTENSADLRNDIGPNVENVTGSNRLKDPELLDADTARTHFGKSNITPASVQVRTEQKSVKLTAEEAQLCKPEPVRQEHIPLPPAPKVQGQDSSKASPLRPLDAIESKPLFDEKKELGGQDGLPLHSPRLPPGFEGKFACMVSQEDSSPGRKLACVKGSENGPQVSARRASSGDAVVQTTACSSNGKEQLQKDGSQTDSDDVPASAKAENNPPDCAAQATGSCEAYPASQGVSPRTPNAIPTWPATSLPPDSSGSHPHLSASKAGNSTKNTLPPTPNCPGVCYPPLVSGTVSTPDPELPPQTGQTRPSLTGSLRGMLSGAPTPNFSSLPDHGQYMNVPCPPAAACPGLSAPAGPSSSAAFAFTPDGGTAPPPRKQGVAQRSHMGVEKQKIPECSSASTPIAVEVHGNVPGRAVVTDGRGAGSSGDNVTGSGMSSHLADPIRSLYLGNIPKGLKDLEASVRQVVRTLLNSFEFVPQKMARLEEVYLRERHHFNFGFAEFSTPKVAMVFLDACQADPAALSLNGCYLKVGRNNQDPSGDTLQRNKLFPQSRDRNLDPLKVIYVANVTLKWQDETALKRYFSNILKGSDEHLRGDLVRAVYLLPSQSDAYLELFSQALADALIYKCTKDPKLLEALGENTFFCRHPKWVPLCAARFVGRPRSAPNSISARETVSIKEFCDQSTLYLARLPIAGDGYFTQRLKDLFEAVLRTLSIEKKVHGSIRNFSWPPGKPFAYIDFDSEVVADAIMDQYIDKVQTFCIRDMPLCIFRHQKYIRPGAIYRHSTRNGDSASGRAFDDDFERRGGVFEEVEHGPEVETGPSDSASRKSLKPEKANSSSVSGSMMGPNDCASSTLHSDFSREMKRSHLEGPKSLTLKGLARGVFEPALRGALNELFERALCKSGVLEPELQVVRSVSLGSEPHVTVSGGEVARALLQCRMPLKLGGERLTLHPPKSESRGQAGLDAQKKVPSFEQGASQGPSDPSSMRLRWGSPRASMQLAPPLGGYGAEPWGRPPPRSGPQVAPDASFPRGMGPPLPPYPPPDYGRPPAPRAPPFCSPPPGYSDPPGGALVPPWRPGPHPTWHYEGNPEHAGHQSPNPEAARGQEAKVPGAECAGVPPLNRKRSSPEGRPESDDSRQKKPRIQDITEAMVTKNIGGWLEAEEDNEEDGKTLPQASNLWQDKTPGPPQDSTQHLPVRGNYGQINKVSGQQGSLIVCGAGVVECDRDLEEGLGFAVNEQEDEVWTRTSITSGCQPGVKLDCDDRKHAGQPGQGGAEQHSTTQLACNQDEAMKLEPDQKDAASNADSACRKSPPRQRDVLKFDLNEIMVESPGGLTPVREECAEPPSSLPNKKSTSHQPVRDADVEHNQPSSAEKGTSRQQSLDYRRNESPPRRSPPRDSRRNHTSYRDDRRPDRGDADHSRRSFDEPRLHRNTSRHDSDDRRPKYSSLHRSSTMPRSSSSRWPDVRTSDEDRPPYRDARSVEEDRQLYRRNRSFDEVRDTRSRRYRPER